MLFDGFLSTAVSTIRQGIVVRSRVAWRRVSILRSLSGPALTQTQLVQDRNRALHLRRASSHLARDMGLRGRCCHPSWHVSSLIAQDLRNERGGARNGVAGLDEQAIKKPSLMAGLIRYQLDGWRLWYQ